LSETQRVNWSNKGGTDVCLDQREQWQYRVADARYGLSRDYLEHWQNIGEAAGHYINPLRFLEIPKPVQWNRKEAGVSLHFIGRTEGFKGPDLFIELLTWLPAGSYRSAHIIGPEFVDEAGPGDFIFVPPFVPHQEINARTDEPVEAVVVRSGQDPIVVNLAIASPEDGSSPPEGFHPPSGKNN